MEQIQQIQSDGDAQYGLLCKFRISNASAFFWQTDGLNITMATQSLCKQITWQREKEPQSISHRDAGLW